MAISLGIYPTFSDKPNWFQENPWQNIGWQFPNLHSKLLDYQGVIPTICCFPVPWGFNERVAVSTDKLSRTLGATHCCKPISEAPLCIYIYIYIYMYICICIHMCMYMYISKRCVSDCIYIYIVIIYQYVCMLLHR